MVTPVKNKTVTIFLPSLNGGGIERVMLNLAIGLDNRGQQVDLVLVQATGPLLKRVPAAIRVVNLNSQKAINSLPGFIRYLCATRPSSVISALECVNLVNLWGRKLSRVPYRSILTTHTTVSRDFLKLSAPKRWLGLTALRHCYGWADHLLAVSSGVAEDISKISGIPRHTCKVIYNPVVTDQLFAAARDTPSHPWLFPDQPPVIVGIGRLSIEKDFATLIKAFAKVGKKWNCRLLILGEGPARRELEQLIEDFDLSSRVALPGFQDNPYAILAKAKVFVLSSRYEGLPTALIEALALGVRVVSTDCPFGPNEILQNGKYGKLVPIGDSDCMAEAMLSALNMNVPAPTSESWAPFTFDQAIDRYCELISSPTTG